MSRRETELKTVSVTAKSSDLRGLLYSIFATDSFATITLMLKLRDANVYVTKVNTNHRAWATCALIQ